MNMCKSIIKIVLGVVVKLLLLLIWGVSIYVFGGLIYDRYVLELYPLGDKVLVLILTFGNIWIIPWLILWCKKLHPFLSKPKIYYVCKSWIAEKRDSSFAFKSLLFIIELMLKAYGIVWSTLLVVILALILTPLLLQLRKLLSWILGWG